MIYQEGEGMTEAHSVSSMTMTDNPEFFSEMLAFVTQQAKDISPAPTISSHNFGKSQSIKVSGIVNRIDAVEVASNLRMFGRLIVDQGGTSVVNMLTPKRRPRGEPMIARRTPDTFAQFVRISGGDRERRASATAFLTEEILRPQIELDDRSTLQITALHVNKAGRKGYSVAGFKRVHENDQYASEGYLQTAADMTRNVFSDLQISNVVKKRCGPGTSNPFC